ncbi:MAG TPA: hypothetical protein PLJ21_11895 [Pseudobdellovibrionaceae bacterium]|nr:hypothetical protein [Pseudobdellovibrionaceae bacterium]
MTRFISIILFLFIPLSLVGATFEASPQLKSTGQLKVGYFSLQNRDYFETQVKPFFAKGSQYGKSYEVVDLNVYSEQGTTELKLIEKTLSQLDSSYQVLLFDFNLVSSAETQALEELLTKKSNEGALLLASAGKKTENKNVYPLSLTVFGKNPKVIVLGERDRRDRIPMDSHFGPEMLTALRAPQELEGKDAGAIIFGAKLAQHWKKKKSDEWIPYFREKKEKNKRLWLDLENIFPW